MIPSLVILVEWWRNHNNTHWCISASVALGGGPVKTTAAIDSSLFSSESMCLGGGFTPLPVGFLMAGFFRAIAGFFWLRLGGVLSESSLDESGRWRIGLVGLSSGQLQLPGAFEAFVDSFWCIDYSCQTNSD